MSEWIEWNWTVEKPYPETLDTLVNVRMRNGDELGSPDRAETVMFWYAGLGVSNWEDFGSESDIVAYRIVT